MTRTTRIATAILGTAFAATLTACGTHSPATTTHATTSTTVKATTPATAPAKPHRVTVDTPDGFAQNFVGQTVSAITVTNVKSYADTTLPVTGHARDEAEHNVGNLVFAAPLVNTATETAKTVKVFPITGFAASTSTNSTQIVTFTAHFALTYASGKTITGHRDYTLAVTPTANKAQGGYLVTGYKTTAVVWE